ncbi:GTP:AMP phosphotransferase, putative [Plasmodium vivax]|uniref:Adenylate kinase 1, putative n=6 Tax=Plasmodium vivax TaxID=5855 RepID=A5K5X5_PLAVS|nr:adenylate kinase 1, putative [Plasmodium vivax]KMZ81899.1 adenylate kinase 1 [Plasmodium vivax India VII]KMZ88185.1 adenylate kinase 1 [Plasmodium vivax Brazil I]KMZ94560.1 adenylate kinase 1 [Plasmodium vivax Mauritania I]KNA01100.1 adenylate kinase 1 [Plasmodium vivax North Korean]EDL45310.1 adenylate kinase 1, putative [Plasmodium vivax]|eukprot:XP_001615037.1 adenylate kinase 1 [Plasmodium vivax Sal-1]
MKAKGPVKIVLFGAPGVGKGTFAEILSKKEKLKHINMGSILRDEIKNKTTIGREIHKVVTSGNLVADELVVKIVKGEIAKVTAQDGHFKGFILDGFPRNLLQCKQLVEITSIDLFVNIHMPRHILLKKIMGRRICHECNRNFNIAHIRDDPYDMPPILPPPECEKCKGNPKLQRRSDDEEEIVAHRLDTYESTNSHLINFFKNSNCNLVDFEIQRGLRDFDSFYRVVGQHL